ncbi:MAG: hypothetical protein NTV69_05235, partial [Caldilinea sp.]|nr:hypothetical protein [Caldilinea sp.]
HPIRQGQRTFLCGFAWVKQAGCSSKPTQFHLCKQSSAMPTGPHSCERVVGVYVIIFCLLSGFVTGWGSFRLKVHFFSGISGVSPGVFLYPCSEGVPGFSRSQRTMTSFTNHPSASQQFGSAARYQYGTPW